MIISMEPINGLYGYAQLLSLGEPQNIHCRGVSLVWTGIIASFLKRSLLKRSLPSITQHHDIRTSFLAETAKSTGISGRLWQSSHYLYLFPDFCFLSGPARRGNQQVLSVARKEPFSTPFLPLSRHSSGGEFMVSAMRSWVPSSGERVGVPRLLIRIT
jgi:hypothetical protein